MLVENIYKKLKKLLSGPSEVYDFNKSNPLGGNGERVDIQINESLNFESLDVYQKNHFRRYQFATQFIKAGDVCGDFACGTGYGSVMLAGIADRVVGADINGEVIKKIKLRYQALNNVEFIEKNRAFNKVFIKDVRNH